MSKKESRKKRVKAIRIESALPEGIDAIDSISSANIVAVNITMTDGTSITNLSQLQAASRTTKTVGYGYTTT